MKKCHWCGCQVEDDAWEQLIDKDIMSGKPICNDCGDRPALFKIDNNTAIEIWN